MAAILSLLDNGLIKSLLYGGTAGLNITAGYFLARSPDASSTERKVAWASFAFAIVLALWSGLALLRYLNTVSAVSPYTRRFLPMTY